MYVLLFDAEIIGTFCIKEIDYLSELATEESGIHFLLKTVFL